MKTLKFILAVSLAAGAVPAFAQAGDAKSPVAQMERAMQQTAARLGNARLNPAEARPPYPGKVNVAPSKDAWRPATSEAMRTATSKDAFLPTPRFSVSSNSDFDSEGNTK